MPRYIMTLALAGAITLLMAPVASSNDREWSIENEMAVVELLGAIRYFHPSDEVENADWPALYQQAFEAADLADTEQALVAALSDLLKPLVRELRVADSLPGSRPECADDEDLLRWVHYGFAAPPSWMPEDRRDMYSSRRTPWPAGPTGLEPEDLPAWHRVEMPGGSSAVFPLSLCAEAAATTGAGRKWIDELAADPVDFDELDAAALGRLQVASLWPVLRHFYPYQEVVRKEWSAILERGLEDARGAGSRQDLVEMIQRLTEPLVDAHVRVIDTVGDGEDGWLPLDFVWDDGAAVVVATTDGAPVQPGEQIRGVNGQPIAEWRARAESLISGSPQHKSRRSRLAMLQGSRGETLELELASGDGARSVQVRFSGDEPFRPERKAAFDELDNGIVYADLTRLDESDVREHLDAMVDATGIVFDLRGYPRGNHFILGHLLEEQDDWGEWMRVFNARGPGGHFLATSTHGWFMPPQEPRIDAPVVVLANEAAISYSESVLGLIKYHNLATVVGGPSAGSNGNIRPLELPGGIRLNYTGMYVIGPNGTPFQGRGLQPDVVVQPDSAGLIEGRDTVLEAGLKEIRDRLE